ncbi:hypothetical protein CYMTET_48923 [Cymbomonas tetramitiformis]|uniref:Uncharacterized protein n=1 Tax=Cymbomonas tetramitiformis TaxID=36881 RepID=A0AAE0EUE6_9CHLO|nr:hypothetical protein CYMTET_48923 [Cymbomonas tetramitiformis]
MSELQRRIEALRTQLQDQASVTLTPQVLIPMQTGQAAGRLQPPTALGHSSSPKKAWEEPEPYISVAQENHPPAQANRSLPPAMTVSPEPRLGSGSPLRSAALSPKSDEEIPSKNLPTNRWENNFDYAFHTELQRALSVPQSDTGQQRSPRYSMSPNSVSHELGEASLRVSGGQSYEASADPYHQFSHPDHNAVAGRDILPRQSGTGGFDPANDPALAYLYARRGNEDNYEYYSGEEGEHGTRLLLEEDIVPRRDADALARPRTARVHRPTSSTSRRTKPKSLRIKPSAYASMDRARRDSVYGSNAAPDRGTFSSEQRRNLKMAELQIRQIQEAQAPPRPRRRKKPTKVAVALTGSFSPPVSKRQSKVSGASLPPSHIIPEAPLMPRGLVQQPVTPPATSAPQLSAPKLSPGRHRHLRRENLLKLQQHADVPAPYEDDIQLERDQGRGSAYEYTIPQYPYGHGVMR